MTAVLVVTAAGLAVVMLASLYRVLRGPTLWDRLTGLAMAGSKTIVLLLVLGELSGSLGVFVDITLSYTLVAYVGSLVLAKYFEGSSPS